MIAITPEFEAACSACMDRYFALHPNPAMQERCNRALRMLRSAEKPLPGGGHKEWAAGIIYAVANDGRYPCGVPDMLNAEFEELMDVLMNTVRLRAAQVMKIILF